jgi:hypothetical protein
MVWTRMMRLLSHLIINQDNGEMIERKIAQEGESDLNNTKEWKDDVFDAFKDTFGLVHRWHIPKSLIMKANELQKEFEKFNPERVRKIKEK